MLDLPEPHLHDFAIRMEAKLQSVLDRAIMHDALDI